MERDPGNYHLRQQMLRVYRADIKTVDAFCTALLRENCHLLGEDARGHALRPDFRVLDENEAQVLRERVLARTLDDFYDHLTPGGLAVVVVELVGGEHLAHVRPDAHLLRRNHGIGTVGTYVGRE